jgi:hypothetical protein
MKRIILLPFTGLLLLAGLIALMMAANLYTFHRLSDESPIAELRFVKKGDFCNPEHYLLYGDQWRLDAVFLKWRPWANLLGFDAMYRIERLGGRYRNVDRENSEPHQAFTLHPQSGIDLVAMLAGYRGRISPVDTLYGSSVYEDMNPDTRYRVYRSQSGLLVRKVAQAGINRTGGVTTIEINKSCAESPGPLRSAGRYVERLLGSPGE